MARITEGKQTRAKQDLAQAYSKDVEFFDSTARLAAYETALKV